MDAKLDEIGMAEALENHVVQQIDVLLRARFKFSGALAAEVEESLATARALIPPPPDAPAIALTTWAAYWKGLPICCYSPTCWPTTATQIWSANARKRPARHAGSSSASHRETVEALTRRTPACVWGAERGA